MLLPTVEFNDTDQCFQLPGDAVPTDALVKQMPIPASLTFQLTAGEAGAVESSLLGSVSAPQVREAELSLGVVDGLQRGVAGGGVGADTIGGLVFVNRSRTFQSVSAVS
jgi:hypothetical protein